MKKQIFLELTTEDNLKRINIDPRLIDSFKRVMTKIQQYFDSHGYSEKIDFESIVNNYLFPQQIVEGELVRKSAEYLSDLNELKQMMKDMESISSTEFPPLNEEEYLDQYIRKNYKVGLKIVVNTAKTIIDAKGEYNPRTNQLTIRKDPNDFSTEELDRIISHEFIHFLTMCGKQELGSIDEEMPESIYESLTELLAAEVVSGEYQKSYFDYCQVMQYINKLAGVTGFESFLARKADVRYKNFSTVFEAIQDAFDRGRFTKERKHGYMFEEDKKNLLALATMKLVNKDYKDVNDLIDNLIHIYSLRGTYQIDSIQKMQEAIIDRYISKHSIANDQVKAKIMRLLGIKNMKRLIGDRKYSPISMDGKNYLIDSEGNIYYYDENIVNKLPYISLPYAVIDGTLNIYTELGSHSYDLLSIDFEALGHNISSQQLLLEEEINILMRGTRMNRPYIKPDIVSTVVARDTGAKGEVLEPIQSKPKLRRPHINRETMSMLQRKIRKFELATLLAQKEMAQKMIANQEVAYSALEEEQDIGMSL